MSRFFARSAVGLSVLAATLATAGSAAAKPAPNFDVYVGDVQRDALSKLVALGVDRSEIDLSAARRPGRTPFTSRRS